MVNTNQDAHQVNRKTMHSDSRINSQFRYSEKFGHILYKSF